MTLHNLSARSFVLAAAFGACAVLAAQQSSNGKTSASSGGQKQSAEVRTEKFEVKQEVGPRTVPPSGDRPASAAPSMQNGAGNGSGNSGSGGSTDKFKQEFGPQSVGTRKDRMTTATPPSNSGQGGVQGNGQSQQSSSLFTPHGTPTRATATLANSGAKPRGATAGTIGSSGKPGSTAPDSAKSQSANPQ